MDSAEKLRQLLNDEQLPPKLFTERNLIMRIPETDTGEGWNTKLELEGIPGRGYYGTDEVFYKRIPLNLLERPTPLRSVDPLTKQLVVDLFNASAGAWLVLDDLEDFTPPELADGESGQVTITAKSTSLGFIGSAVINLEYGRSWLDSVVYSRNLPVMKHPIQQVDYRKSARMLTWSKDFTSLRDSLLPVKNRYADWVTFSSACAEMGIPAWTEAGITDNPTSAIPDSNPAFQRVVIQRQVVSGGMLGDLYFHYNVLEEI
jgi:hypothetical protein